MGKNASKVRSGAITVVNPYPNEEEAPDIEESEKLHDLKRFLPILPSSMKGSDVPEGEITECVNWRDVMRLALLYQQYLRKMSTKIASEQHNLVNRFKDIDLFTTGVTQNFQTRFEKTERLSFQVKTIDDLAKSVSHAKDALEKCIELANKLNGYLQEGERLDIFRMEIPNSSTPSTSQSELDSELSSHVASL